MRVAGDFTGTEIVAGSNPHKPSPKAPVSAQIAHLTLMVSMVFWAWRGRDACRPKSAPHKQELESACFGTATGKLQKLLSRKRCARWIGRQKTCRSAQRPSTTSTNHHPEITMEVTLQIFVRSQSLPQCRFAMHRVLFPKPTIKKSQCFSAVLAEKSPREKQHAASTHQRQRGRFRHRCDCEIADEIVFLVSAKV